MGFTKTLENKKFIQMVGVLLFLAPFVNVFFIVWSLPLVSEDKWTFIKFYQAYTSSVPLQRVLDIFGFIVGSFFLTGSRKAWQYFLVLIGGYVVMQVFYLQKNWITNPSSVIFLPINLFIFGFIYTQLVQKKVPIVSREIMTPKKSVPLINISEKILIHFDGFGPWAQLSSISKNELVLNSFGTPPPGLQNRAVEIQLKKDFWVRAVFERQEGQKIYFKFQH